MKRSVWAWLRQLWTKPELNDSDYAIELAANDANECLMVRIHHLQQKYCLPNESLADALARLTKQVESQQLFIDIVAKWCKSQSVRVASSSPLIGNFNEGVSWALLQVEKMLKDGVIK